MPETATNRIVDAVLDTLQTNLPAKLVTYGLTAIHEDSWLPYDPGDAWRTLSPLIWVDVDSEEEITLVAAGRQDRVWNLIVAASATGANARLTARSVRGYHDLIKQTLEEFPLLGGEAEVTGPLRALFTRNAGTGGAFLQETARLYRVRSEEAPGEA